ncbi:DUF2158 domain-containing protein [Chitinolyticbacter meiyuanensis]|uniref:DUF2158 domain-containing protein n=1 Tax=Chitinolyticbacter meiyuanensis TaxID=682798 RepID=UPI0016520939|nr:DUF2158 domain-containing protein [Chitinolyticbacter meiyuanensis]
MRFEIGDIVVLKGDTRLLMSVVAVEAAAGDELVTCSWYDETGALREEVHRSQQLEHNLPSPTMH